MKIMLTFKPTPEQEQITKTKHSALINAGPGTGKTRTAIEKARDQILSMSDGPQKQVLFLSFSNAAIHRLTADANIRFTKKEKKQVRFMTYHSCAVEILRVYGRFVGLPPRIRIMDTLEEKLVALERGWFEDYKNKLFLLAKEHGLLSFDTIIPLTVRLLSYSERLLKIIGRRYPLIIVDEFQDTSEDQWHLLCLIGQNSQVVAFSDPNQIIYSSMHAATVKRLDEFKEWKRIKESEFSVVNFRCDRQEILEFADSLLRGKPYKDKQNSQVQLFKLTYRDQLRATFALIWKAIKDQVGSNKTIGFLTPSNRIAEEVAVALRNPPPSTKVSFPVYTYIARDEAAHDAVILALAAVRDYAVAGENRTCSKAAVALLAMDLAWNSKKKMSSSKLKTLIKLLEEYRKGNSSKLVNFTAKSATICNLNSLIPEFVEALTDIQEFKTSCKRISAHGRLGVERVEASDSQLLLFDNLRANRRPKGLEGYDVGEGKTHVLNYHKAKGREFDFVVMVVDPRGESNKTLLDEQRRLYYVCATRAKEWLGVIYYSNDLGRVLGPVISPM